MKNQILIEKLEGMVQVFEGMSKVCLLSARVMQNLLNEGKNNRIRC
jgi:hypothetical protein